MSNIKFFIFFICQYLFITAGWLTTEFNRLESRFNEDGSRYLESVTVELNKNIRSFSLSLLEQRRRTGYSLSSDWVCKGSDTIQELKDFAGEVTLTHLKSQPENWLEKNSFYNIRFILASSSHQYKVIYNRYAGKCYS